MLTVLPLFHVGGLNIQTTPALQARRDRHAASRASRPTRRSRRSRDDQPTLTVLVPATIQALIEHPRWRETDVASLRAVTTGSTAVPQPLIDAIEARGVPVLQVYGSTETCPIAVYTRLGGDRPGAATRPACPGSIARPASSTTTAARSPHGTPGEVVVRGPNVFFEYWGNAAATREALRDGWYHTGDIGARDADGYFYIHDRKKNMIISGGENIYPAEVERVLHAASGRRRSRGDRPPRSRDGRRCRSPIVVLRTDAGADARGADAPRRRRARPLQGSARRSCSSTDLPRNALGKVQHFRLREMVNWTA